MDYSSNPNDNMHPTTGKHTAGDPSLGIPATIDRPEHMNAVYDELLEVISHYGLTPDEGDLTQVRKALQAALSSKLNSASYTAADVLTKILSNVPGLLAGISQAGSTGGGSGYVVLPFESGGVKKELVIQFGLGGVIGQSSSTLTLPTSFSAASAYALVVTRTANNVSTNDGFSVEKISASQAVVRFSGDPNGNTFSWIAIGY